MKIAVSGGRTYSDRYSVRHGLDSALKMMRQKFGPKETLVLIHGGAKGADDLAHQWAVWRNKVYNEEIEIVICEADWEHYGKSAGPARNSVMADGIPGYGPPDLWVFFPGGPGTRDAYRKAMAAGIQTMCINIDDPGSPYISPQGGGHAVSKP